MPKLLKSPYNTQGVVRLHKTASPICRLSFMSEQNKLSTQLQPKNLSLLSTSETADSMSAENFSFSVFINMEDKQLIGCGRELL